MATTNMSRSRMISAIDDSIVGSKSCLMPLLGGSNIIDRYVDIYSLTFSEQGELYRLTHADLFELISQIGHTPHYLPIRADDARPRRQNVASRPPSSNGDLWRRRRIYDEG